MFVSSCGKSTFVLYDGPEFKLMLENQDFWRMIIAASEACLTLITWFVLLPSNFPLPRLIDHVAKLSTGIHNVVTSSSECTGTV